MCLALCHTHNSIDLQYNMLNYNQINNCQIPVFTSQLLFHRLVFVIIVFDWRNQALFICDKHGRSAVIPVLLDPLYYHGLNILLSAIAIHYSIHTLTQLAIHIILQNMILYTIGSLGSPYNAMHSPRSQLYLFVYFYRIVAVVSSQLQVYYIATILYTIVCMDYVNVVWLDPPLFKSLLQSIW